MVTAATAETSDLWTDRRSGNFVHETGLVLLRKGAIRKLIRRSLMTGEGRTADIARAPDRAVLRQAVFSRSRGAWRRDMLDDRLRPEGHSVRSLRAQRSRQLLVNREQLRGFRVDF